MRAILVVMVLLGAVAGPCLADEVELRSGVILNGDASVVGDDVMLVLPSGGQMTLPKGLVKNLRQDGTQAVSFQPTASPPPLAPLPAFQAEPVAIRAVPPAPAPAALLPSVPTAATPGRTVMPAVPAPYAPTPAAAPVTPTYTPSSPPPPPPPPSPSMPGVVYERQGIPPMVVRTAPPAPVVAAPCAPACPPPCDPCAKDPCDPCPDLGPWSIGLNLSWTQAGGNSDSLNFKVDFEVVYDQDPWKWVTSGLYAYAESGDSVDTNRTFLESQLNRDLDNCSYVFVNGSYDRDEPAELEYRLIGNAGYGRSIIKQEMMTLDVEAGAGVTWQKRTNLPEDRLDPSAYLGIDFMRDFNRGGKFTIDYDFLPNLNDWDLSIMRFDAKYTVPCMGCLNFVLGLRIDWQFEPEDPGVDPVDWIASAGLGVSF